jgi:hypothetical protein
LFSCMFRSLSLILSLEPPKEHITRGGSWLTIVYQLTGAKLARPSVLYVPTKAIGRGDYINCTQPIVSKLPLPSASSLLTTYNGSQHDLVQ